MPDAVILFSSTRDPEARRADMNAARAWQAAHGHHLAWCHRVSARAPESPHARFPAFLVRAPRKALAAVPLPLRVIEIPELVPRRVRAAIVRNVVYDQRGRALRGLSHFAPGTLVYVAGPYSGDGYERTLMLGRDRETSRYIAMMGATARLKQWHLAQVTDPEALFVLRHASGNWDPGPSHASDALPNAPPPIAWQPPAAWNALVERWFEPERPRLAECAAVVLDCPVPEARTRVEQGTLGTELVAAQKGRYRSGAAPVVRSAAAAWRALAPSAWQAANTRVFARPDLSGPSAEPIGYATRPFPGDLHTAVVFCSAPAGIARAEALARELAAMLPPPTKDAAVPSSATPRAVWHFVHHAAAAHLLRTAPPAVPRGHDATASRHALLDLLRALTLAVMRDDDIAAHDLVAALPGDTTAPARGLAALVLEIVAQGYALVDVTNADATHLACPLLPVGRKREHATTTV
jgi:hypothetical protein